MPVNKDQYVIVNIWTSKDNKAIPGANVGHISLTTADEYISLWPDGASRKPYKSKFFQSTEHKVKSKFAERLPGFKRDYQEDCMLESLSESGRYTICSLEDDSIIERNKFYLQITDDGSLQYKVISPDNKQVSGIIDSGALAEISPINTPLIGIQPTEQTMRKILKITAERGDTKEQLHRPIFRREDLEEGEIVCRFDSKNKAREIWVEDIPPCTEEHFSFFAIKLIQANFRMVLYSLDIQAIEHEFNLLKESVTGWSLAGSNVLTRALSGYETSENCSSLAFRCLNAGGLSGKLKSKLSSKTSSAVSPDDLLNHIVAFKEKELKLYPQIKDWVIENITTSELSDVQESYAREGLNANAEDDFFPGFKPSNTSCIIS